MPTVAMLLALVSSASDAPRVDAPLLPAGPALVADARTGSQPQSLRYARKLAEQLRYEEAIVEYQRYLGELDRPEAERARALLELAFLHQLLDDKLSAQKRGLEALELDPALELSSSAPAKQLAFLDDLRLKVASRSRLTLLQRASGDDARRVRAELKDPTGQVRRVLLRHALAPSGPFYSSPMSCQGKLCEGDIPAPAKVASFTAWYYAEALNAEGEAVALAANPVEPLRLSVVQQDAWYESPWLWAGGGAALVAAAGVVYLLSPPPPK